MRALSQSSIQPVRDSVVLPTYSSSSVPSSPYPPFLFFFPVSDFPRVEIDRISRSPNTQPYSRKSGGELGDPVQRERKREIARRAVSTR